jgi:hypothetical protein
MGEKRMVYFARLLAVAKTYYLKCPQPIRPHLHEAASCLGSVVLALIRSRTANQC